MAIRLEGITKRYEGLAVVSRVSLEIERGEMFVLLGPSGSGKSTLLRMIAGLAEVDEGSVSLDGRDVTRVSPSERGIGFVFQNYALFRNMSVADNVEFPLRVRKRSAPERRKRREELLELVGLAGFGGRRPSQLSGGQQQRVALARALAEDPAFLLLDEPFGALDARIRTELRQTLRRIQRETRVTSVFVTHDQEEAFELADRIGVMNFGRLLDVGPPDELYLRPRSAFVATFLGVSNLVVAESTPTSVKLGSLEIPLGTESPKRGEGARTQLLLRPEALELAASAGEVRSPLLGRGHVESRSFAGAVERLRVRMAPIPGVRQIAPAPAYGQEGLLLEVTRPEPEAAGRPVRSGDEVALGVRRSHLLSPASVQLTVRGRSQGPGDPVRAFAARLAERLHGSIRYPDEADFREPSDGDDAASQAETIAFGLTVVASRELSAKGGASGGADWPGHLLAVPGDVPVPARVLVSVAVGEPGKTDVALAERIAWRLGAEVTVLSVVEEEEEEDRTIPQHVTRFLDASLRALRWRGVRARTVVRRGEPVAEILGELTDGGHDMLVLGAPLGPGPDRVSLRKGVVGRVLDERPNVPVLIVRSDRP